MLETMQLAQWARDAVDNETQSALACLDAYSAKPGSAKRLHQARKALARLRTAVQDLGELAGTPVEFRERVDDLHRRAGKVRDADVLLQRLKDYLKDEPGHEGRLELRLLRSVLRDARKRARRKLMRVLHSGSAPL